MKTYLALLVALLLGCTKTTGSNPADAAAGADAAGLEAGPFDHGLTGDAEREPPEDAGDAASTGDAQAEGDAGQLADAGQLTDAGQLADAASVLDASPSGSGAVLADPGPELAILFVGNSYTNSNRLDRAVCALAAQTGRYASVRCEKVTAGGYKLTQHAADAANGQRLGQLLDPANPEQSGWDAVVLQEQSQIPGFPEMQADLLRFRQAVVDLNDRIAAIGAETALLMTWGRRDGDGQNEHLYPDYLTMQARLEAGYTFAAEAASTPARTVHVLPVGVGWRHTRMRDAGGDFRALYSGDGSHPAQPGTYLSALIILDHLVGVDIASLEPLDNGPDAELAARLKGDAAATRP